MHNQQLDASSPSQFLSSKRTRPHSDGPAAEEDRKERRRKLGLPEEPTEEEKAAAAAKAQPVPEQRSVNAPPPPRATLAEQLRTQLVGMKKAHAGEEERLKTCWATLMKYCGNIASVGHSVAAVACHLQAFCVDTLLRACGVACLLSCGC